MANGRCKVHGGKSTGPRTPEGDGSSLLTDGRVPRDTAAQLELEEREGALMWPERFGAREVARIKAELGPYMASGRLEQMPVPDKGGIFQRDWWQPWDSPDGKFPVFSYIVASLDGAFTEKEENDPSALTVCGECFRMRRGRAASCSCMLGVSTSRFRVYGMISPPTKRLRPSNIGRGRSGVC